MGWILGSFIVIIAGLAILSIVLWCDREELRSDNFNLKIVNRQLRDELVERSRRPSTIGGAGKLPEPTPKERALQEATRLFDFEREG